ncbi:GNAT family N-acetyltransferase [Pseudomarimonas salicorniae]|uniref:GNAT family N-acetyltransferase n=1 Tax=Pseudomarimonas salicorniae TaxID=2933270 RepID=A0ABT0GK95_9GAMM|nr:GNAT family N-acetyltransferase [Lysobacter sp. CAU 1642]MCK7594967.1 GNAT family N-acetyltransferase [Lysobacter sp. CAU 1642]
MRDEREADLSFLQALYASTRTEELAPVPWTADEKSRFLLQQFHLQRHHYRTHYAEAGFWLLVSSLGPHGRIYVHCSPGELRLMDIALMPDQRGRGIGTALIRALQGEARASGRRIGLHVEPGNPALDLYRRLGFGHGEVRGAYRFLQWPADAPSGLS